MLKIKKLPFVLMYHRILDETINYIELPGMYVHIDTFKMHAKFLRENFNVISLNNLLEAYFKGECLDNTCAITFDDGWRDNYTHLFPIVKKHQLPVSVFLTTGLINTTELLWPEEICYFLSHEGMYMDIIEYLDGNKKDKLKNILNYRTINGDTITTCIDEIKNIVPPKRDKLIKKIINYNRNNKKLIREMLSWDEINEMKKSGLFEFYPHGHNHLFLSELENNEVLYEIEESINIVKKNVINQKVDIFCYASGRYDESVVDCLKKNDMEYALLRSGGYLKMGCDRFHIPRIPVHDDISYSKLLFRYYLSRYSSN